jgi:hypothetical protein
MWRGLLDVERNPDSAACDDTCGGAASAAAANRPARQNVREIEQQSTVSREYTISSERLLEDCSRDVTLPSRTRGARRRVELVDGQRFASCHQNPPDTPSCMAVLHGP